MKLDLSIVIVNYNTKKLMLDCINSVIKNTNKINYELIVVDNNSDDGSLEELLKLKTTVKLIKNKQNFGFAKANNQGIKIALGKYILLLNSDTLIQDDLLQPMLDWMDRNPSIGVASCSLKNKDGSIQGSGGYFPTLPRVFSWMTIQDIPFVDNFIKPYHPAHTRSFYKGLNFYQKERQLDWVTGAFFLIRAKVVERVGLLDEDYFMYCEEMDYCFRVKKRGYKVMFNPRWSIIHLGGASGKNGDSILQEFISLKLFYKKHYQAWQLPILRILLKIGSIGRIILFGLIEGKESAKIYAKAFREI